jgi:hypothetical protein
VPLRRTSLTIALLSLAITLLSTLTAAPAQAAGGWQIIVKAALPSVRCIAPTSNNTTDRGVKIVVSNVPCRITYSIDAVPGTTNRKYLRLDANGARCLVPSGSSIAEGVSIVTGSCVNTVPFHWVPEPVMSDGGRTWYRWRNYATDLCMTADPPSTTAGAPIVQRACRSNAVLQQFSW